MSSSRTHEHDPNHDNMASLSSSTHPVLSELDHALSDTLSLIFASMRDVIFSQRALETKLKVPPGVPAEYEGGTGCTKDTPSPGDTRPSSVAK
ncbi:hypothetical protein CERZMDRAFT_107797 [Cercospora zeae-maydis SCOH1-5]|uniref:Uncharacterized protein n=1 Tax=Cercospora zeae-maydis SCOH1-5 TaxID=717836 RepID=A0A6A6F476_9PEZI|nr:hypothetical protein CERZMDRAFT_107797 [Cercospora zeae-maydis SCOH1-5]